VQPMCLRRMSDLPASTGWAIEDASVIGIAKTPGLRLPVCARNPVVAMGYVEAACSCRDADRSC